MVSYQVQFWAYKLELLGFEHIGIGGDYNKVYTYPHDAENVSQYPLGNHYFAFLSTINVNYDSYGEVD